MYYSDDPTRDWDMYEAELSRNAITCPKCGRSVYESDLYETDYGVRCGECVDEMRQARLNRILKRVNKKVKEDISILEQAGMFANGDSWDDGWNYIAENLGLGIEDE